MHVFPGKANYNGLEHQVMQITEGRTSAAIIIAVAICVRHANAQS